MKPLDRYNLRATALAFVAFACCKKEPPRHPDAVWFRDHRNMFAPQCAGSYTKPTISGSGADLANEPRFQHTACQPPSDNNEYLRAAQLLKRKQDLLEGKGDRFHRFDSERNEWVEIPLPPEPEPAPRPPPKKVVWIRYVAGQLESHWTDSADYQLKPALVCDECRKRQGEVFPFSFAKISDLR